MLKRIRINLIQKPVTTILLWILFLVVTTFMFFSVLMYNSSKELGKDTVLQLGANISLTLNNNYIQKICTEKDLGSAKELTPEQLYNIVDENIFKDIKKIKGFVGIESISTVNLNPINFENSQKYQGENPYEQQYMGSSSKEVLELESQSINAVGSIDISAYSHFQKHYNTLIKGAFPTNDNRGILISEELAKQNNLSVGDTLEVRNFINIDYELMATATKDDVLSAETKTVQIVGIYSTNLYYDITVDNSNAQACLQTSPYNTIYTDYLTICDLKDETVDLTYLYLYLDNPLRNAEVFPQLMDLSNNQEKYTTEDFIEMYYDDLLEPVNNFHQSIMNILRTSIVGGLFVFIVIFLAFNMDKEIGTLIILGEKRSKIMIQKSLEFILLALVSLPVSLLVGFNIAVQSAISLAPKVEDDGMMTVYEVYTGDNAFIPKLDIDFNLETVSLAFVYLLATVLICILITSFKIHTYKTKTFLKKGE